MFSKIVTLFESEAMKEKTIKKPIKTAIEKKLTTTEKNRLIKELSKEVNKSIALRAFKDLVIGR